MATVSRMWPPSSPTTMVTVTIVQMHFSVLIQNNEPASLNLGSNGSHLDVWFLKKKIHFQHYCIFWNIQENTFSVLYLCLYQVRLRKTKCRGLRTLFPLRLTQSLNKDVINA
jgi:hypothetical protein